MARLDLSLRFLAISLGTLGVAWLHGRLRRGEWRAFSRAYLHFGLLGVNLSLWFLSVFGSFGEDASHWHRAEGERAAFSALWAGTSIASIWLSRRIGLSTLRAYGIAFLAINSYTFYFQFVVANSLEGWWVHLLLVGGSLVLLAFRMERRRSRPGAVD